MKYFVAKFDETTIEGKKIYAGVKYEISENQICLFKNGEKILLDIERSREILKVKISADEYYFYFPLSESKFFATSFMYGKNIVSVSIHSKLSICINGKLLHEINARELNYSHFKLFQDMCLIFFTGDRDYLVAIKGDECISGTYIDEYNELDNELLYLVRLKDCLNHGRVFKFQNREMESYLVYLDDEDMSLKSELVGSVFLDCVMAGNLKYANNLLSSEIRQENSDVIKEFFGEFDYYYAVDGERYILINKNTLSGIFTFEYCDNLIINITELK